MIRLSREQVRQIDRLAVEQFKIPGIVLMENAARAAADVAVDMIAGKKGPVLILCGGGNNGGDGLAIARHLHNRRLDAKISLTVDPAKYQAEALANWQIIQAMGLSVVPLRENLEPSLIIDAVFGTGLTQTPRDPFPGIVAAVERMNVPVLAVDVPSGLDCDTGEPLGTCIRADRTVTFVAEKIGFAEPTAKQFLGQVTVGDIGCPIELISQVAGA
jgi:NAD(P)H-hydrate epimerase